MLKIARFLLLLPLLSGCRPSLRDELGALHAERVEMEADLEIREGTPMWIPDFAKHLIDGDTYIPSFIYDHILAKLYQMAEPDIRVQTEEGFDPENPGESRGRFWRISGGIARIWPEKIPGSRAPLKRVYAGIIYTEEGFPILFHVIKKPEVLELGEDFVELDGLFLKTMLFQGAKGKTITAPFFLARSLRKLM